MDFGKYFRLLIMLLLGFGVTAPQRVEAATGRLLRNDTGLYPRAIRLSHNGNANGRILASVVTFTNQGGVGAIYESLDNGQNFAQVGTVADPETAPGRGMCCSTLYELPQQIGAMPAGTLLWANSAGQDLANRRMALRIWKSNDLGRSWSYLSSCAVAGNTGGLWEPEFSIARDGQLVCYYSDETDGRYSQKLVQVRSRDGITWTDRRDTIASGLQSDRPGMAVVRKLPNGSYIMVFEICTPGGQFQCVVHYRSSVDGWDWGVASGLGIRPETADGRYFKHAPTIAWGPDANSSNGRLYLIGQLLYNANGTLAAGNGQTIMTNTQNGAGVWQTIQAPVAIPSAFNNYCPNYSSSLLPSADGASMLEIATDYDAGVCKPYYASGPSGASATNLSNGVYTITSKAGNGTFRLDVDGCNAVNLGKVQLYQPFNNNCQKWRVEVTGGYYTLTSLAGNGTFRLDVDGCNAVNLAKVQLYQPFDNDCQKWQIQAVGAGFYTITSKAGNGTFRLDVDGCNAVNLGKVQLYQPFDNDCQKWRLDRVQ
ncbi:MAG: RICIN domain-containing protein [Chloroflexi bacterium]|nr:RICIN domain-containing protein [Chloroflexota bacterium]